jgi:hypothetical protein
VKFGKRHRLTIQVDDAGNSVVIEYPITVDFDIQRTLFSGANTGRFTIYNLSPNTRNQIFHDRYDVRVYRGIIYQAGYVGQDPLPIIFQGNVQVAYSARKKADWVTEIRAFDGGVAIIGSQTSRTFPAGIEIRDMIKGLMDDLKGPGHVTPGAVGDLPMAGERGATFVGNTWGLISGMAENNGALAFIDNEKAHVLKPDEYLAGVQNTSPIISGTTGLLRAQMQFRNRVDVDVIFDPRRSIGQIVTLQSEEKKNNGDYIVKGIAHRGIISGAVDAETVTTLNLDKGSGIPVGVLQCPNP